MTEILYKFLFNTHQSIAFVKSNPELVSCPAPFSSKTFNPIKLAPTATPLMLPDAAIIPAT